MTIRNSSATTGKRTRSQNEEEPSLTASKKRRFLSSGDSATAGGSAQSSKPRTATTRNSGRGRREQAASASKDAPTDSWEVTADSEEERVKRPVQQNKNERQGSISQASTGINKASVYDVPDSDSDELGTAAAAAPRPKRQRSGLAAAAEYEGDAASLAKGDSPGKKKRGRPRRRDREAPGDVQNGTVTSAHVSTGLRQSQQPGRSVGRGHASPPRRSPPAENQDSDDDVATASPPVRKTRLPKGPAKGRPGAGALLPKGILTPRKGGDGDGRRRKNVAFDHGLDEGAPGNRTAEAPSRSLRKRREPSPEVANGVEVDGEPGADEHASDENHGNGEEDEEDDQVCAICSKPDSEPPNEIVFCDNCDMAVHQECYGLPEIPEGDWICRNCSQDGASSASRGAASQAISSAAAREEQIPDIPNFDQHLRSMQRVLVDRCTGRRRLKLRGQDEAYEKAYQLVEQTIVAGEGNSMLVIGARGCGKTALVESIISDVSKHHKDQFHVVRLNGFIHTDDKLALREIWRQLGKEMEVEDELVNKTNNYADTMASLLALLSHPSEIAETQDGVTSKSIIFVIDEFDLFAAHARQTLLYNLFDIAQARKAPIAVLGLTTRLDVVESLEKRVKSRFSHRYVYLSLPKSLPAYWDICRQGLVINDEDMVLEGIDPRLKGHRAFWDWWNGKIEALYKSPSFMDHLETHFYSTKSPSAFLTTCILPLAALSPTAPSLRIPTVSSPSVSLEPPDSKLHLLGSLSDLDLSMLIAAARLDIVAHTDTVNFAMAYDEYASLMGKQRVQSASAGMLALGGGARVWGRGTAGIAWERLVALGLLVPAAAAAGGRATAGLDAKMWKVDVALEEIPAAVKLNAVLARWCREI
ncbi:hypothetical protein VTK56DRAFT_2791 [Thermocarpiscus australiensis]